jgi:hypothetical protein
MNTSFVKSAPNGDFAEVSVLMTGWQNKIQNLVSQNKPIKYDIYPLLGIPEEIKHNLEPQGYCDLILENDQWQHFLVPNLIQGVS